MIDPPPACMMCGRAYLQVQNTASRPARMIPNQVSLLICATSASAPSRTRSLGAALFTSMSRRPKAATASAISRWISCSLPTSAAMKRAVPPARVISSTTALPAAALRPLTMTFAPSAAKRSAMAWPMPLVEPVMMATLSFKRMSSFLADGISA